MKLHNFKLVEIMGSSPLDWVYIAQVSVTVRKFLFWKHTTKRTIMRRFGGHWHFTDTGEFTPGYQADLLAQAWNAQQTSAGNTSQLC